ncbi:MAG: TIGR04255 family protein [Pseudomonadota bacterium]|nr:TIGR04255 family protein [Pseudomonadota bacterium]
MQRRVYKNPPIEEALCDFRFENSSEWDPMLPLVFRDQIKDTYPGKPVQRAPIEANLHAGSDQAGASFLLRQELGRIQFPSEDGKALVAIGQNVLSVHMLRPYQRWEEFRPRIEDALVKYSNTMPCDGIQRIGLRYINKIEIKNTGSLDLNKYFVVPPMSPPGFPTRIISFITRTEHIYDDEPVKLILTFTDTSVREGYAAFLLDLDLVWEFGDTPLPVEEAMSKVDILRDRERDAFEQLITDDSRGMFDAISE